MSVPASARKIRHAGVLFRDLEECPGRSISGRVAEARHFRGLVRNLLELIRGLAGHIFSRGFIAKIWRQRCHSSRRSRGVSGHSLEVFFNQISDSAIAECVTR